MPSYLSSTAIAGVIGAGGLGNLAYLTGFTRNQNDVILVSTILILIIVFIIQFINKLNDKDNNKY